MKNKANSSFQNFKESKFIKAFCWYETPQASDPIVHPFCWFGSCHYIFSPDVFQQIEITHSAPKSHRYNTYMG